MEKIKTRVLVLITALLLALSALLSFVISKSGAEYVEIYEGGALIGEYPLSEDRTIELGHNTVRIENGRVYMYSADCKNRICVNTGAIDSPLYPIVCLPNRVMIRVTGDSGFDAAAGD
ncbi:MAG: NusG domain II-containing protein [Clostridia bacterium]|nr:NusG domain II-containing protein [Clostridia bacterium]